MKRAKKILINMLLLVACVIVMANCPGPGPSPSPANSYTIGGTVSGLTGTGLVLQDNASDDLAISANGVFTFATKVADGAEYTVTVKTQPTGQTCTASNNTGTVSAADVTTVSVVCSTNAYTVGGTVSGLTGTGLVLQNNSGDNLAISANGTFTFATKVAGGAGYNVTVKTQPTGQTCTVTNGSGAMASANVTNVSVNCTASASIPPAAPTWLTATAQSSSSIQLTWINNSNDETGFKIERSTSSTTGFTQITTVGANVTTYTSTGLSASTTYYYRVRAYNGAGDSSYSNTANATTQAAATIPAAPSNVHVSSVTQTTAVLGWTNNATNATGNEVGTCSGTVSVDSNNVYTCTGTFTAIKQLAANVASYNLTGLSQATEYYYFVRAYNAAGASAAKGTKFTTSSTKTLRIVNDLYDQYVGSDDWGTWNTLIRVRIASTQNDVLNGGNTYEVLTSKSDSTCFPNIDLSDIPPKYNQSTSYKDFDVTSYPSSYYVYIQTGWWDPDPFSYNCYAKHVSVAYCCNCSDICYKYAAFLVSNHTSGTYAVKASQYLPPKHWCNSGTQYCH